MATMTKNWYVLRVASNREDQVRDALERKVKIENLGDLIGRIIVPTERIKRVKQGQQKVAERKLYPGYVFVEMELNNDGTIPERSYYLFKDTQGVGDFIGQRNKPSAMGIDEVNKMLQDVEKSESLGGSGGQVKVEFKKGDPIKIKEGPFENFEGTVDEIFPDKGMVRVIVTIFGRSTPLELEYWQLEKVDAA
ncbi:MAG TPA: transcription termination/antitermination protein NusG [Phycisphaerae bacterium]|jgi:transcriptional antiterminator NusG|nr:transcription termination/antitermination protein NusG [Phycisphaerae bacterium]